MLSPTAIAHSTDGLAAVYWREDRKDAVKVSPSVIYYQMSRWQEEVIRLSDKASDCGEYTDELAQRLASEAVGFANSTICHGALSYMRDRMKEATRKRSRLALDTILPFSVGLAGVIVGWSVLYLVGAL